MQFRRRKELREIIQSKKQFHLLIKKELGQLQRSQQTMIEHHQTRKNYKNQDNAKNHSNKIRENEVLKKEQSQILKAQKQQSIVSQENNKSGTNHTDGQKQQQQQNEQKQNHPLIKKQRVNHHYNTNRQESLRNRQVIQSILNEMIIKQYSEENVNCMLKLIEEESQRKEKLNQRYYKQQQQVKQQQKHCQLIHSYKMLQLVLKIKNFKMLNSVLTSNRNQARAVWSANRHYEKRLMSQGMRLFKSNQLQSAKQQQSVYRAKSVCLRDLLKKNYLKQLIFNCQYKVFTFKSQKLHYQQQLKHKNACINRLIHFSHFYHQLHQIQILLTVKGELTVFRRMKDRQRINKQLFNKVKLLRNINKHRRWNEFVIMINYQKLKTLTLYNQSISFLNQSISYINQWSGQSVEGDVLARVKSQEQYEPSKQINTQIMKILKHYNYLLTNKNTLNNYQQQQNVINSHNASTLIQQQLHETIVQFSNPLVLHIKQQCLTQYLYLKKRKSFYTKFNQYLLKQKSNHNFQEQAQFKQTQVVRNIILSPTKRLFITNLINYQREIEINKRIEYFSNMTIGYVPNMKKTQSKDDINKNEKSDINRNDWSNLCINGNSDMDKNEMSKQVTGKSEDRMSHSNPFALKYYKHYFVSQLKTHHIFTQQDQLQQQVYYKTIFGSKLLFKSFSQWKLSTLSSKLEKQEKRQKQIEQMQKQQREQKEKQQREQKQKQQREQIKSRLLKIQLMREQEELMLRRGKQKQQQLLQKERSLKQEQEKISCMLDEIKNKQAQLLSMEKEQQQSLMGQRRTLQLQKQSIQKQRAALSREKGQIEEKRLKMQEQLKANISIQQQYQQLLHRQKIITQKQRLLQQRQKSRLLDQRQKQRQRAVQQQRDSGSLKQQRQKQGQVQQQASDTHTKQAMRLNGEHAIKQNGQENKGGETIRQQFGYENRSGQKMRQYFGQYNEYSEMGLNEYSQSQLVYGNDFSQLSQNAELGQNLLTKRLSESVVSKYREEYHNQERNSQNDENQQTQLQPQQQHQETVVEHSSYHQQAQQQQLTLNYVNHSYQQLQHKQAQQLQHQQEQQQQHSQKQQQHQQSLSSDSSNQILANHIINKNKHQSLQQNHQQIPKRFLNTENQDIVEQEGQEDIHNSHGDINHMMSWLDNKIQQNHQQKSKNINSQQQQYNNQQQQIESYNNSPKKQSESDEDFFKMLVQKEIINTQQKIETIDNQPQRQTINNQSQSPKQSAYDQRFVNQEGKEQEQEQHQGQQHQEQHEEQKQSQQQQDEPQQQSLSSEQLQSQPEQSDSRFFMYADNQHDLYIKRLIFNHVFKYKTYRQQQSRQQKLLKNIFTHWKLYHQQKHSLKKYLLIYQSLNNKLKHINTNHHSQQHQQDGIHQNKNHSHSLPRSKNQYQHSIITKPQSLSKKLNNNQQQQPQSPAKIKFFPTFKSDLQQFQNLYPSSQ